MKRNHQFKRSTALIPALVLVLFFGVGTPCFASWDYGNGRHGAYDLTNSMTIEQLYQAVRSTNDPPQYDPTNPNAIPNFQTLIITNGATLTANAWNGTNGGWIALKVQGVLSITAGAGISASGIGYRGGGWTWRTGFSAGIQGESYAGSQSVTTSANYGGGGGAETIGAGGGGGYSTPGQVGNFGNGGGHGGAGGGTYGTPSLDTVYLGSGGGGGNQAGGAGGGGAIVLNVGVLNVQGGIQAAGGSGGIGGAGSGGSILLSVGSASLGTNQVFAVGGNGSPGWGGNGGDGRIAVRYAETCSGFTVPSAYTFNDTNSDSIQITNQPASQTNFLGDSVLFTVGFTTISPYALHWYFDGAIIPNATNQTLSISPLSLTNQGFYWLVLSNAVMTITNSPLYLTVLDTNNAFGDGIPNWWKTRDGLSLTDPTLGTNHPPGDPLTYQQKYLYLLNPTKTDSDGDGLSDYAEIFVYHSNPLSTNTSGDGIPDGWKVQYGLSPSVNDANNQVGATGVTYLQVYQYDTTHTNQVDPRNPFFAPGTSIYEALNNGQHTNRFYYDHEDRLVGAEYSRGVSIAYQYDGNGNLLRQTVLSRASETNGLPVLWLFLNGLTNQPGIAYEDSGNGWNNYQEWLAGTETTNGISRSTANPGTNLASIVLPFSPSNFVMGVGNLYGLPDDGIVVSADGNPGTNSNSLMVLTHSATGWSTQQVNVGPFGVTSIAVGQPPGKPSPAIYCGLRAEAGGTGSIVEFAQVGTNWQQTTIANSTNGYAFVSGVITNEGLIAEFYPTNTSGPTMFALSPGTSNGLWTALPMATNTFSPATSPIRELPSGSRQYVLSSESSVTNLSAIEIEAPPVSFFQPGSVFQDNFNRPDGAVGNGWLQCANSDALGQDLVIQNGALVGQGGVYRPFPSSSPIHIIADISGSASSEQGYGTVFTVDGNTNVASGFGVIFERTPGFPNSAVYPTGYSNPPKQFPPFQFAGTLHVDFSIDQDGSSAGSVSSGSQTFPFSFPPNPIPRAGSNFCFSEQTGSVGPAATLDNFSISDGCPTTQIVATKPTLSCVLRPFGLPLACGLLRGKSTNNISICYATIDDKNKNGVIDQWDDFLLSEYSLVGTNCTLLTASRHSIGSTQVAQTYCLAAVNFLANSNEVLFTGEPDGRVFAWTDSGTTNSLQRQLFSESYYGMAWHAMSGVSMAAGGDSLAGLLVDPSAPNECSVVLWEPGTSLPQLGDVFETAPSVVPIPSTSPLGTNAALSVRIWDAEGDSSTPFLQYQFAGSTNWANATLTTLDGAPYSSAVLVTALPMGANHTLVWNTLADLGSLCTNILVRARAQDFMLVGDWSVSVPYQVNTLPPFQISPGSTNPQLTTNGFQIQISGLNGTGPVIIYASTNLIDWIPLFTNPAFNGTLPFLDPAATNFHFRFYRANEQ